jgi:hypothetical protein
MACGLLKANYRRLSQYCGAAWVLDMKIQTPDVKLDDIMSSGGDQTGFWMPY